MWSNVLLTLAHMWVGVIAVILCVCLSACLILHYTARTVYPRVATIAPMPTTQGIAAQRDLRKCLVQKLQQLGRKWTLY